uniref:HsdS-type I specificity subunit n=1 Tax=Lactobacillus delbrueckii subsp. lactis TaxID=29397 RepID=Q50I08_LACDL|nr:HsdS-type I specificity subunit [Lactobacillus delbrueckii subsp. lactis]
MKDEKKAPKLRFKGFTDDWEQRKLGDVCEPITDSIDTQKYPNEVFAEYSMPAFDASMKPDIVLGSSMNSVRKIITRPCLLVNKLNVRKKRIWYVKKPNKNAVCSAEFIPLHSDTVDLTFLNQVAKSETFTRYLENHSSGSSNSQKRITPRSLMLSKLHIPTIEEQKLIGKIFESLDHTITLHEEKKRQLERLKSALLQKMFADESGYPVVRFEGFSDEWEQRKLKDVVEKQIKGKAQLEKLAPGEVEYLDTSRLNGGQAILTNGLKDVTLDDILILWDGSKAGTVYHGFEGALGSTLKAYRTSANSKFVYQYLKRHQDNIYNNYRTPNIPHVQKDFLNVFTISVPVSDEQEKIGSFFKQLDDTIDLHQRKLDLLKEQKKGFLQKMFV